MFPVIFVPGGDRKNGMGVPGRFPGLRQLTAGNRERDREKRRDPGQNGTGILVGQLSNIYTT